MPVPRCAAALIGQSICGGKENDWRLSHHLSIAPLTTTRFSRHIAPTSAHHSLTCSRRRPPAHRPHHGPLPARRPPGPGRRTGLSGFLQVPNFQVCVTRRKAFLARPRLHVSRALSSPVRPLFHAQVLLVGPDGVSILLGNVHTIDGSGAHRIRGRQDQRQQFKRKCLENVMADLFETRRRRTFATLQGQLLPAIMCCGDLNLRTDDVVQAVQDFPTEIGASMTVVGEGWGE